MKEVNAKIFWDKTSIVNDCVIWNGSKNKKGYGRVNVKGSVYLSHRVSYYLSNGSFNESLCVLHKCDNPSCVNANHLFLGTKAENNADMIKKGRACFQTGTLVKSIGLKHGRYTKPELTAKGERSGSSKVSDFGVECIRKINLSQKLLSKAFGLHISTINRIINNKTRQK